MKKLMKCLVVVLLVLACCSTSALAVAAAVPGDNSVWSFKPAPDDTVWPAGYAGDFLNVGSLHGGNNQLYAGYTQLDLSAYAGQTALGDGTLTLWAKRGPGMDEQPGGFEMTELTKDYVQGQACWNRAATGDDWTVSGSSYWDKAGWGDKGAVVGEFAVPNTDWEMKTMVVSQAQIQSWLGDSTVSLLIAPKYDGFYAYKYINVGAEAPPEGSGPITLTFNVTPEPATMVLLGLGSLMALRRRRS